MSESWGGSTEIPQERLEASAALYSSFNAEVLLGMHPKPIEVAVINPQYFTENLLPLGMSAFGVIDRLCEEVTKKNDLNKTFLVSGFRTASKGASLENEVASFLKIWNGYFKRNQFEVDSFFGRSKLDYWVPAQSIALGTNIINLEASGKIIPLYDYESMAPPQLPSKVRENYLFCFTGISVEDISRHL